MLAVSTALITVREQRFPDLDLIAPKSPLQKVGPDPRAGAPKSSYSQAPFINTLNSPTPATFSLVSGPKVIGKVAFYSPKSTLQASRQIAPQTVT